MARKRFRDAAVLVGVFRREDRDLRVVLIRRGTCGVHAGQLALPGGQHEPQDASLLATALREAQEEVGISGNAVNVLAALPIVETRSTGFRIYPFLARILPPRRWWYKEGEIEAVLEVKLQDLLEAREEGLADFPSRSQPRQIQFYRVGQERLWGATFRILEPLLPRLLNGEWEV